ncbi:MAG: hypothetical protein R3Y24_04205 [Eubacteriales bacterium]
MVVVLLTWIYYAVILFILGVGVLKALQIGTKEKFSISFNKGIVAGVVVTTVYAQIFSVFYKVSFIAHMIMVLVAIILLIKFKKEFVAYGKQVYGFIGTWDCLYWAVLVLAFAFFTSRGTFHADTLIYHAGAVQWIEEYGIVKGLANLQLHFGYNSAYFAFVALFSLKFLTGVSLHTTTGFIACVFCLWACHKLKYRNKERHITTLCSAAMLLYALINVTGFMSPASDYVTNFTAIYIVTRWVELWENGNKKIEEYAALCLACVYLLTLKVSGGALALIVLYPAVVLIKNKEWKKIAIYIGSGLVILLPFLIRNIIISGWLIYPFNAIDLFDVDWKVPEFKVINDSNQIQVWGKCLYDVTLADMSLLEWFPIWWEEQPRYNMMLILGNVLAVLLLGVTCIRNMKINKKLDLAFVSLVLGVIASGLLWFFMAPFVRYGLAYLLVFPAIAVGEALRNEYNKQGVLKVANFYMTLCIFVCITPMIDQYVKDAGVVIKQRILEPYYIVQMPYEVAELKTFEVDGVTFYTPESGESLGYAPLPSTAYAFMMEESQLRGDSFEDGFQSIF